MSVISRSPSTNQSFLFIPALQNELDEEKLIVAGLAAPSGDWWIKKIKFIFFNSATERGRADSGIQSTTTINHQFNQLIHFFKEEMELIDWRKVKKAKEESSPGQPTPINSFLFLLSIKSINNVWFDERERKESWWLLARATKQLNKSTNKANQK